MKILILTPDIYTRGGIARYTATLASALGCIIGPKNVHVQPLLGVTNSGENPAGYWVLKPVTARLNAASKLRFGGRALGLGHRKYSLVVCTHVGLSPVAALMRLLFGTPFWITCHGREAWPRFPPDVRWAVSRANLVLPISRFTADRVAKVNGIPRNKMRVLYNAIPDEFVRMLLSSNLNAGAPVASNGKQRYILSVGTVTKGNAYKGYDTVIKALPTVLQAVPCTRYQIVGKGDDIDRLKRLASENGVLDHLEFKGSVSDAELASCYQACDVFVLPSRTDLHNGKWNGEGFGRVYVEAALAGKPVVGSYGGGAAEAVIHEKTGLLIDPTSISNVANALITLLRNHELAARMGLEGQRWAKEVFTVPAIRSSLEKMISPYAHGVQ